MERRAIINYKTGEKDSQRISITNNLVMIYRGDSVLREQYWLKPNIFNIKNRKFEWKKSLG